MRPQNLLLDGADSREKFITVLLHTPKKNITTGGIKQTPIFLTGMKMVQISFDIRPSRKGQNPIWIVFIKIWTFNFLIIFKSEYTNLIFFICKSWFKGGPRHLTTALTPTRSPRRWGDWSKGIERPTGDWSRMVLASRRRSRGGLEMNRGGPQSLMWCRACRLSHAHARRLEPRLRQLALWFARNGAVCRARLTSGFLVPQCRLSPPSWCYDVARAGFLVLSAAPHR